MSCNDILEKLEKEGIISAEGVIDSYLLCKHAEELFGKSYLKKHNIVLDDDKKEAKLCKRRILKMNKEEINKLTAKIESCWDENNPGDVRSFDERLKKKLTPEEYELVTSWR